jgi:YHS domain-containing protein
VKLFKTTAFFAAMIGVVAIAGDKASDDLSVQKAALSEFNPLIGKWRGVGMPRRGSTQGAWQEQAEWIWDFADHGVAVRIDVDKGTLTKSVRFTFDPASKEYVAAVTTPGGEVEQYRGKLQKEGVVVLTTPAGDEIKQLTITRLSDKRTLILFEKRAASQASFNRIAEIGYTREGTRLATSATSGPECIVTGGTGTMEVKYKGQTYYVCCTGCKQAFEDDPEGVIKEAAERRKREREKASK